MSRPVSKAAQVRQADRVLRGLLRTPKSRPGLIAAVTAGLIARNYVYGWLAEGRRNGTLTTYKSGTTLMYQVAHAVTCEVAPPSEYPRWLDPRTLPISTSRIVVVDGEIIRRNGT